MTISHEVNSVGKSEFDIVHHFHEQQDVMLKSVFLHSRTIVYDVVVICVQIVCLIFMYMYGFVFEM